MREPKSSFRRASRPATSPWRTTLLPKDNVMPRIGPAILGGAALATTIGIAIGASRRSRAGAHL